MKILANLGKLNDGHTVLVTQKADRIEYVLATGFDEATQSWGSGTYLYDIEDLARAVLYANKPIGYDRMTEIASKAIDGLREDDEESAQEYCREEIEMDDTELEFFGLNESEDDYEA